MRRSFVLLVVLVLVGVLGQVSSAQNAGPTDLERERLIRIVEPVIYPLQRLGLPYNQSDWEELLTSCGISGFHDAPIVTEMGQAWIVCVPDKWFTFAYEGPNPLDRAYGDRKIEVVVQGFARKEPLCVPYTKDITRVFGEKEFRAPCSGDSKIGMPVNNPIRADIIARFTITTKVERYTKKEVDEHAEFRRKILADQRSGRVVSYPPFNPPVLKVGDVKHLSISVTPVTYEFLNK